MTGMAVTTDTMALTGTLIGMRGLIIMDTGGIIMDIAGGHGELPGECACREAGSMGVPFSATPKARVVQPGGSGGPNVLYSEMFMRNVPSRSLGSN